MASPSSSHQFDSSRLPVPVSITLYNRLPPLDEDDPETTTAAQKSKKNKWFRPDYTVNLLVSIRLEIVLLLPEERILYSSDIEQSTVHAVWDHLNERVKEWSNSWEDQSESTVLRILLLQDNNSKSSTTTSTESEGGGKRAPSAILIDSIPLHPHALRRLPNKGDGGGDDSYENDSSFSYSTGQERTPPPAALPPNAVLIHYTDGMVRVEASLYHVLLQNNVIQEVNPRDISLLQDDNQEDKRRSRFHDTVFDVLDQAVVPQISSTVSPIVTTSGSLLETDNEALATPVGTVPDGFLGGDDNNTELIMPALVPSLLPEVQVDVDDLHRERAELLHQLEEEELWLQQEQKELQQQVQQLHSTRTILDATRDEISQIRQATADVLQDQDKVAFSMTIFQRKLVQELKQIYPITIKQQTQQQQHQSKRYCIAGTELPLDLFWGHAIHEDEVSAALGFVAHALVLLSKYLAVALRHRMVCNSSRSAIQDDGTSMCASEVNGGGAFNNNNNNQGNRMEILPLFLGRSVERQQLERGMILLHRNVDCLAQSQGMHLRHRDGSVEGQPQQHLLAKLQQVFDHIVGEGK